MPAFFTAPFIAFILVLARVGGMVLTAPLFGSQEIPARMRFLLAFTLSLMVTPMQLTTPFALPVNLVQFALSLGGELLIGGLLGFGVTILLGGAQLAGQIISQMSGLSLAEVFDPTIDQEVPALANFLNLIALAVFVIIGGHRLLLSAVLDTYTLLPFGHAAAPPALGSLIPTLLTECFSLAVRGAAPAIVALMLATIVLGLISRTLPQLNVMAIGFGLNTLVSFVALAVSIGAVAWLFQEQLEPAVQAIVDSLRPNV